MLKIDEFYIFYLYNKILSTFVHQIVNFAYAFSLDCIHFILLRLESEMKWWKA